MAEDNIDTEQTIIKLVKQSHSSVSIQGIEFSQEHITGTKCLVGKFKEEMIICEPINSITPERLELYLNTIFLTTDTEQINGWTYKDESSVIHKWVTSYDENAVTIGTEYPRSIKSVSPQFVVTAPTEDRYMPQNRSPKIDSPKQDLSNTGIKFSSLASAYAYAIKYITDWSATEVDIEIRKETIAQEQFQNVSGIGTQVAEKLIQNNIRTLEQLSASLRHYVISRYIGQAKKDINQMQPIESDSYVSELKSKIVSEQI